MPTHSFLVVANFEVKIIAGSCSPPLALTQAFVVANRPAFPPLELQAAVATSPTSGTHDGLGRTQPVCFSLGLQSMAAAHPAYGTCEGRVLKSVDFKGPGGNDLFYGWKA